MAEPDSRSLGVPVDEAGAGLLVDGVQVKLPAQPTVIALLDLRELLDVRIQVRLGFPRRAVDALQHLVLLVAAPVGPGDRGELERIGHERACRRDVGPAAQVSEGVLRVGGDLLPLGKLRDNFQLVGLVLEDTAGLRAVHHGLRESMLTGHDGAHLLFDDGEIVHRHRAGQVEIVVKAVVDRGADRQLRLREHLEHRLSHDVGEGVPDLQEPGLLCFFHLTPPKRQSPVRLLRPDSGRGTAAHPRTKSRTGLPAVPP